MRTKRPILLVFVLGRWRGHHRRRPGATQLALTPTNSALFGTHQVSIAQIITGSSEGNLLYDVSVVQGSAQVDLAAQILAGPTAPTSAGFLSG